MIATNSLKLDHITVVARSLEEGCAYIKDALGIDMPAGGVHPLMGTHNKLMSLGQDTFLELISIDPSAVAPPRPRWFNLDKFEGAPRLGTWVLNTDDLESTLTTAHPDSGRAIELSRGDLKWLMAVADDGALPLNGAFPVLMQWPDGPHPAANMIDLGCRLEALTIEHPRSEEVERFMGNRIDRDLVKITSGPEMNIRASIQTPSGLKLLF